jgi:hypothetical protein
VSRGLDTNARALHAYQHTHLRAAPKPVGGLHHQLSPTGPEHASSR